MTLRAPDSLDAPVTLPERTMGVSMILHLYRNHLLSGHHTEGTVRQRLGHIERLSRRHPNLTAVSSEDLEGMLAEMRLAKMSAEHRKAARSSYRVFYQWAARKRFVSEDPSADLVAVPVPATVPRIAPDDVVQLSLVCAAVEHQAMVLLARLACLRLSELTMLPLSARRHDTLTILGKGEKERLVYINDDLMHVLLQREREVAGARFYFPGRFGSHMHPQSVNKIITRVTGCNPHSLRHAGATAAYNETGDLREVQRMLGHASMATTQRYLHTDPERGRIVASATSFRSNVTSPHFPAFPSMDAVADLPLAA